MTSIDGLLPCPFCGSDDVELRVSATDAYVACNNCGCRTGIVHLGPDEASEAFRKREVCAVWNTRTPAPSLGDLFRQCAALIKEDRDSLFECATIGGDPATLDEDTRPFVECRDLVLSRIDAALSSMRPVQEEGVGEDWAARKAREAEILRDYELGTLSARQEGWDIAEDARKAASEWGFVEASHPEASPPSLGVEELREALLGPDAADDPSLGRFGWLEALVCDLKNNPDAMAALSAEDPAAHWESLREVDALIRDVREALSRVSGRSDLEVGRPASPATWHSAKPEPQSSLGLDPSGECQAQGAGE